MRELIAALLTVSVLCLPFIVNSSKNAPEEAHGLARSIEDDKHYLVGDWDGDGKDNIAVRRGADIFMDFNFDGAHDKLQGFGNGKSEDQYLVGDWDGDGKDNIAVRRGADIFMDFNFDGAHDKLQRYGNGKSEDQYLAGDWNGDRRDNIAVRRHNNIHMDFNFDSTVDKLQSYGNFSPPPPPPPPSPVPSPTTIIVPPCKKNSDCGVSACCCFRPTTKETFCRSKPANESCITVCR